MPNMVAPVRKERRLTPLAMARFLINLSVDMQAPHFGSVPVREGREFVVSHGVRNRHGLRIGPEAEFLKGRLERPIWNVAMSALRLWKVLRAASRLERLQGAEPDSLAPALRYGSSTASMT